ncbi:tail fiber assembly protein [Pluralibacter sp.]|uniref:tail fiber assembly protein n=1 Tax=Pluralibacter sp. TaxID=1920032 RepID=UPI0025F2BBE5|nr:tail fiber assembly protein [Pluralibacter sp.]MBV8044486.1 tail fiber assembly protein [Pluralibacter sp.]
MRYALISTGTVENIVVCEQAEQATGLFPDVDVVNIDGEDVGPGWAYADGIFTAPAVPEPTPEELITQAEQQKAALRQTAESEISWRHDAVDAGIATAEEAAALAEWKKYRVLLMRVDTSKVPDVEWPTQPV